MTSMIKILADPDFRFADAEDALKTLAILGDKLAGVRAEERTLLDLIVAAAISAARGTVSGQTITKQSMINAAGVSRQTIFEALASADEQVGGSTA